MVVPGVLYGDRVNEVDLRIGKILRFGRTRANVGVDIYNLLNSAAILSYNQSFIPERRVAGADVGDVGTLREAEPAVRLLSCFQERQS